MCWWDIYLSPQQTSANRANFLTKAIHIPQKKPEHCTVQQCYHPPWWTCRKTVSCHTKFSSFNTKNQGRVMHLKLPNDHTLMWFSLSTAFTITEATVTSALKKKEIKKPNNWKISRSLPTKRLNLFSVFQPCFLLNVIVWKGIINTWPLCIPSNMCLCAVHK